MNHADAAGACERHREARLRDRVHRGRDDRNRERDLARQACRGGDVVRKDVRLGGDEQNVVEGQPFAGELLVEREKALELVSCDVCLSQGTIVSAASDALSRLEARALRTR